MVRWGGQAISYIHFSHSFTYFVRGNKVVSICPYGQSSSALDNLLQNINTGYRVSTPSQFEDPRAR